MKQLSKIQTDPKVENNNNSKFPILEPPNPEQLREILDKISLDKALNYDLFNDLWIKQKDINKYYNIFSQLWSIDWDANRDLQIFFNSRLIPLNKNFNNIPKKSDFRPIIVSSILVKIIEARWVNKLKEAMIEKIHPSQNGFIPSQNIFSNIIRAVKAIKERISNNKCCYGYFVDLKNAYNSVSHNKLFKKLNAYLDHTSIRYLQKLYSKTRI